MNRPLSPLRLICLETAVVTVGVVLLHLLALALSLSEPKVIALSLAPPAIF
ncbi:MAG TPA: hypothetical protein VFR86_27610 [Burkholderiaceae bacterium]|nr:hypothetical protein [Burkholderiaceae bacterium]